MAVGDCVIGTGTPWQVDLPVFKKNRAKRNRGQVSRLDPDLPVRLMPLRFTSHHDTHADCLNRPASRLPLALLHRLQVRLREIR